jgi:hypothetical protein
MNYMLGKKCFQIVGLGLMWSVAGWSYLPLALGSQPQVPQVTLKVSKVDGVNAKTWCNTADARGTGRPLGFNRVGFYRDPGDPKNKEYLIGCITNNSARTIEYLQANYEEKIPSGSSGGAATFDISTKTFKPGQTLFFAIVRDFGFSPNSRGATFDIYNLSGWMSKNYSREYLQKLIIQRR